MKRRPLTIEHRRPDDAELQRREAHRRRLARFVRCGVAQSIAGSDFAPAELAEASIAAWARVLELARDGAGAAAFLGATVGRLAPPLPSTGRHAAAEAHFARRRA